MKKTIAIFAVLVFTVACSSINKGDGGLSSASSARKTAAGGDKQQIIAKYGQPDFSFEENGLEVLGYDYTKVAVSGGRFIPLISPYMYSYGYKNITSYFYFNAGGKLVKAEAVEASGSFPPPEVKELK